MKTFEDLIEEVYHNSDLRHEFIKYAQLKSIGKENATGYIREFPQLYRSRVPYKNHQEITYILPDFHHDAGELRKGLLYVSSALFKTLSHRYRLEADEIRKLREAVADKYAHEL